MPTHNNAKTVGETVQAIRVGLLKYFPRERVVIVNADGGSKDSTREVVAAASINDVQRSSDLYALRTLHCISTIYGDEPATEVALRTTSGGGRIIARQSMRHRFAGIDEHYTRVDRAPFAPGLPR